MRLGLDGLHTWFQKRIHFQDGELKKMKEKLDIATEALKLCAKNESSDTAKKALNKLGVEYESNQSST